MKNPWLKFYPADWRADPALRMCSLQARGLWMEALCLMHDADPQGSLLVNGRAVTEKQLAALAGAPVAAVAAALGELEDAGVFSRDENGTIFSRRMRRDIEKAARDKANGKGGGNPNLLLGVNPPDNPAPNPPDKGEDKAQRLEARSHMPEAGKPASAQAREPASPPAFSDQDFEAACRHAVAGWDPPKGSFKPMLALEGDREAIVAVLRQVATSDRAPVLAWKLWAGEIVPERLAVASKSAPARASPAPPADDGPKVNTPSGPRSVAYLLAQHEAGRWSTVFGKPPGHPDCLIRDYLPALQAAQ